MIDKNYFVQLIISKLEQKKEYLVDQWDNPKGTETRYLVIDNLLSDENCLKIYKSLNQSKIVWNKRKSFREKKNTTAKVDLFDDIIPAVTDAFQEKQVVEFISKITNIKDLEPDNSLYAAGISSMKKNDFLNPHIDNSHNADKQKYRRLNLLYYVSPNWDMSKGGNFELWDKKVQNPKVIVSKFNRLVVMETGPETYHSVNSVLVNEIRYCVSNYYFSKKSFNGKEYNHVTSFTGRPNQKLQRVYGKIDNFLRNIASQYLKFKRLDNKKILRK